MDHVSKPLLGVLVAVVAFAALWMVALKPHGSSASGTPTPTPAPASAPPPAAASAPAPAVKPHPQTHRSAPPVSPHAVRAPRAAARPHPAVRPVTVAHAQATPTTRLTAVQRALLGGKVLALLFYNPNAADDQAVKHELAGIPGHGGHVFSQAIPLGELSSYAAITSQIPVNFSPTLVIVDRAHQAHEIVGFADSFEIAQRVTDALSTRPVAP